MEEKLNETNVEAARVNKDGAFQLIKGEELEEIIKELAWVYNLSDDTWTSGKRQEFEERCS